MITFQRQLSRHFKQLRSFTCSSPLSSKSEKDDKKDDKKDEPKVNKEEATNKLNDLLQSMLKADDEQPKKDIQLVQAVKRKREKPEKEKSLGEKLEVAAKEVAASIGGDVKKTESELLDILLRRSDTSTQILSDVLKDIQVEKTEKEPDSRAKQVRDSLRRRPQETTLQRTMDPSSVSSKFIQEKRIVKKPVQEVDIFNAEPTSYFKGLQPKPPPCEMRTWQACVERDLRLAVTHPPANVYEEMIQWTDKGMLWKFPIDNEQGLDEEKKVSFEEHIFLENHLEGWCPERGPIRRFMELVCVGLSKNHWLTVEEKKNHIQWYRDYFAERKTLIAEIGAGDITINPEEEKMLEK